MFVYGSKDLFTVFNAVLVKCDLSRGLCMMKDAIRAALLAC